MEKKLYTPRELETIQVKVFGRMVQIRWPKDEIGPSEFVVNNRPEADELLTLAPSEQP